MEEKTVYTMADWKADRMFKATPGQRVEAKVYDEMFNVMPIGNLKNTKGNELRLKPFEGKYIKRAWKSLEPSSFNAYGTTYLGFAEVKEEDESVYYFIGEVN